LARAELVAVYECAIGAALVYQLVSRARRSGHFVDSGVVVGCVLSEEAQMPRTNVPADLEGIMPAWV
jgi:hypothetical protein